MKKTEKRLFAFSIAAAMLFVMPSSASAMHIMEGYLPMGHAIAWGALCLPFLVAGFISIKKTISQHRKALLILAMAGSLCLRSVCFKDSPVSPAPAPILPAPVWVLSCLDLLP